MAFKMKGHTLPGINQRMDKSSLKDGRAKSSAFQKEGVKKGRKLTEKEIKAHKRATENYKRIRAANPDDFELRKHGMPGESPKGTWTHKKSGKIMKDYVAEGVTLPTVEVKGKKKT